MDGREKVTYFDCKLRAVSGSMGRVARVVLRVAIVAAVLAPSAATIAEEGGAPVIEVMRIEEDWEVVLNEPDLDLEAPQFHTLISPYGDLESYHLQVCWNYRETFDFFAGGMQLHVWKGDCLLGQKCFREDQLSTTAETLSWTQAIETNGSVLAFEISNGSSTTWGTFGGSETRLSGNVAVPNLNGYRTSVSVANSWISYGANRIDRMRIKEVRYYDRDNNLLYCDQGEHMVYELQIEP